MKAGGKFYFSIQREDPQVIPICNKFWELRLSAGQHLFFTGETNLFMHAPILFSFLRNAMIFLLVVFYICLSIKTVFHCFLQGEEQIPQSCVLSDPQQRWVCAGRD